MDGTALDNLDVFGIFDDPPPPDAHLTVGQYVGILQQLAQRLGLDDVAFRFNLPPSAAAAEEEDASCQGNSSCGCGVCGHPPLCAHLAREGGRRVMQQPHSLPTVACEDADEALRGAPHVHCLFCLQAGQEEGGGSGPVMALNLRHAVLAHYTQHMQTRDACLTLLDEEDDESQMGALEVTAEREGRHVCFIASAGTAACPIVVAYCAACDQLAPLATFATEAAVAAEANKQQREAQSVETAGCVMARLLLACDLLLAVRRERETEGRMSQPLVHAESYIFLPTPFLFGEDEAELTEMFESGAMMTHTSAVLPSATVSGTPASPRLRLLESAAAMELIFRGLPPYHFADAVVGFVMQWPTEAATDEKVAWVLRQRAHIAVQRRLVYVEDIDEWVIARVFHHLDASSAESSGNSSSSLLEDPYGTIRRRKDCRITKMVSLTLIQQYTLRGSENGGNGISNSNEMDGCPYSMEARAVNFFAGMTALAKAMEMTVTFF
ncbi:hypothetical protein DQ04_03731010 [Trypanosoma grayi]|uniref:hypothetical protein n=1 Tax=Trypanosoma grayi TaxID=71804 RepID=UPI0004F46CD7|nr:hypothetical protein DQ04_03731010 [Trypanosoma grayi]KEG10419.1 hypothetical protein DQ04_03731010 [Trypanosoma grayi]